ncbi:signal peptidase II, partial [Patescibacteria group bacterium]|nr:signal peptidase II [Patescibacteria group bacterium]
VLLIVLIIIVIGLIIETIITLRQHRPDTWGWLLLLTGSVSNLYDRLVYGGVIDYLASWWTFLNLADILIVTGLIILIIKHQ